MIDTNIENKEASDAIQLSENLTKEIQKQFMEKARVESQIRKVYTLPPDYNKWEVPIIRTSKI